LHFQEKSRGQKTQKRRKRYAKTHSKIGRVNASLMFAAKNQLFLPKLDDVTSY
jgi:hypothetical protein